MDDDEFDLFHYDAICRQHASLCDDHIRKIIVPAGIRYECDQCGRPRLILSSASS